MQEDHALTAAIKALYATLQRYPTHAPDVAERAQRLANFHLTDGVLSFTLERHPHILGRLTQGMASSGYFLVEQRYVFSLEQETITLTQEHCTGWEADAEALADENVETVLDYGGLAPEYRTCASEDEVRARAACEADSIIAEFPETTLFMPDEFVAGSNEHQQWEIFCQEFSNHWRAIFIAKAIERWQEWREDEDR